MDLIGVTWRKSTFSSDNAGACVEVGMAWRKSSFSSDNAGTCVEVGTTPDSETLYLVRDSKDPQGPRLSFHAEQWGAFVAGIKDGELR